MKKLASRYVSLKLDWQLFLATHPELRYFTKARVGGTWAKNLNETKYTLEKHLSLVLHRPVSHYQMREIQRKGFVIVKRRIQQEINPEQEKAFVEIYSSLFTRTLEYGKFKKAEDGKAYFIVNGKTVARDIVEKRVHPLQVERNDIRIVKTMKEGKEKVSYEYRGREGTVKTTGIVHNYVNSLFYQKGEPVVGQRKGINTRLWYNIVSANDILQILAMRLWGFILDGHDLCNGKRFRVDENNKSHDELSYFLMSAGRNLFLNSLEVIKRNEDGDVKHKRTEKGKYGKEGSYERNTQRMYQFGSMSELIENVDGTFKLIPQGGIGEIAE